MQSIQESVTVEAGIRRAMMLKKDIDEDLSCVTVRRPVPVPFPVLLLLAHNMIDQSTILYFISRVLLVWKH